MKNLRKVCFLVFILSIACSDDDDKSVSVLEDNIDDGFFWQYVNTAHHEGTIVDDQFSSPKHSLRITAIDTLADGFSFWAYRVTPNNIPEGVALTLKVKVKTDDVKFDGVYVALRCDTNTAVADFETTEGKETISGTKDFKEYEVRIGTYPKNTTSILIFLIMSGRSTGTAYFDDIRLTYK